MDAGQGVVESLAELGGPWPIDSLLLTHAHFDHIAGLDWLANSLERTRDSRAVAGHFSSLLPQKLEHRLIIPGDAFSPGQYAGLQLTPIPVVHFKDSIIYVLQFWRDAARKSDAPANYKAILCWDILRFSRRGDMQSGSGHGYRVGLNETHPPLLPPNLLLIKSNTWNPHPETGHISFTEVQSLIRLWQPKTTRIVHYGGWEDRPARDSRLIRPIETHA